MKFTFWTVIWKMDRRNFYGIPKTDHGIISMDGDQHGIKFNVSKTKIGRPKIRWADVYPLFETKEEADAYRAENEDWETVTIECKLTPTSL
jgi:hypothetical protein